jgi:hypothetical protein
MQAIKTKKHQYFNHDLNKGKNKFHPRTGHESSEGE